MVDDHKAKVGVGSIGAGGSGFRVQRFKGSKVQRFRVLSSGSGVRGWR
jgi:hypothetical protein